jgi:hypothetical protein
VHSVLHDSFVNEVGCPAVISDAAEAAKALGDYARELYKGIKANDATKELLALCALDHDHASIVGDCETRVLAYLETQLGSNKCFMGLPSQVLAMRKCYECPEGEQYPWAAQ